MQLFSVAVDFESCQGQNTGPAALDTPRDKWSFF